MAIYFKTSKMFKKHVLIKCRIDLPLKVLKALTVYFTQIHFACEPAISGHQSHSHISAVTEAKRGGAAPE